MTDRSTTNIEKCFIMNNVYKRSRKYFDIVRLNQLEHQQELQRRQPKQSKDTIDTRLSESFICSDLLLSDKVNSDIGLFGSRKYNDDVDQTQTTITNLTYPIYQKRKKPKTIDMRKMLPRSDIDTARSGNIIQDRFNNFRLSVHKPRTSMDFDNYLDRERSKTHRYVNVNPELSQESKVGKIKQKMSFDQSHYRCFVDMGRYEHQSPKKEADDGPIYDEAKIRRGELLTRKTPSHLVQFYRGHGKAQPSQFDYRLLKDNENHWRNIAQERKRLRDYSVQKKKQDQILSRVNRILERKKIPDERHDYCDEKYFRRNSNI